MPHIAPDPTIGNRKTKIELLFCMEGLRGDANTQNIPSYISHKKCGYKGKILHAIWGFTFRNIDNYIHSATKSLE